MYIRLGKALSSVHFVVLYDNNGNVTVGSFFFRAKSFWQCQKTQMHDTMVPSNNGCHAAISAPPEANQRIYQRKRLINCRSSLGKDPFKSWKSAMMRCSAPSVQFSHTFSLKAPIVPPLYSVLTLKLVLPLSKEHGSLQLLFRLPLSTRFTCFESANYVEVINSLQSFRSSNHVHSK